MTKVDATTDLAADRPRLLDWDSEFWGLTMGTGPWEGLGEWAAENMVGLMCLLIPANKPGDIQKAEQAGYRFMDVRVTLERRTASVGSGARLARAEDTAKLREIARTAYRGVTRFYADPSLPDERCDDLYDEWIRKSCAGYTDIVLVAEREDGPVGYVTCNAKHGKAQISLIAVHEEWRGKGVGRELVSSAVNWAKQQDAATMSVVTQGRNVPAQKLFQECGFVTTDTQVWLHKRFSELPPPRDPGRAMT